MSNRQQKRAQRGKARKTITQTKGYLLVYIGQEGTLEYLYDLSRCDDDEDCRQQALLKMTENAGEIALFKNAEHRKQEKAEEQAQRVREAKEQRSRELADAGTGPNN